MLHGRWRLSCTTGEIDIGESITNSVAWFNIDSIVIVLLFDGPELGDVNEAMSIVVDGTLYIWPDGRLVRPRRDIL